MIIGKMKNEKQKTKKGQAMLIAILIIFVSAIALGVAAATIALTQTNIIQNQKLSSQAKRLASSCMENALMRMTKEEFTDPVTLEVGSGSCIIEISGTTPNYQVLATAEIPALFYSNKKVTSKLQADVSIVSGVTTVTSLKEIY